MKSIWSPELYMKACCFAAGRHHGQTITDNTIPYIIHPVTVSMEIMTTLAQEAHEKPDLAIQCSLLHDVIEDTATGYSEIMEEFGKPVADGVSALSKDKQIPKHMRMEDSLERIRTQPLEVWMVKMADRINNLQPPPKYWNRDKIIEYYTESEIIFQALSQASQLLSQRLRDKIEGYRSYF